MKQQIAAALAAASIILLGAGCAPAAAPVSRTPPTPALIVEQQAPAPAAQKMRDPSTFKPGDSFVGWTVDKVTDLRGDGPATPGIYSVTLKGPRTATGTYHYFMDEGLYGEFIMVFKPNGASEDEFPGENGLGILLANKKVVLPAFGLKDNVEASGTATIIIGDYNFQSVGEGYPAADLTSVVSK